MLICLDDFSIEDDFEVLCNNPKVNHIVLFEPHNYRSLDRRIKDLNKNYIRLDNLFEKQRNADYLKLEAHKFTEEHLYYKDDNYTGFSDFTILPKDFTDGGSTPRAVVIHLTYADPNKNDQIWIRHFTSENGSDSITNVQEICRSSPKGCEFLLSIEYKQFSN